MKCIIRNIIMCGFVIISAFSCEEDESALADEPNIDFQFRLLNEDGLPTTVFKEGENFVFSFLIINNSDQSWVFQGGFGKNGKIDETSDFCRVYKVNSESSDNEDELIDMGKPWETMFCTFQLGTPINPNDTLKLEIPWMPSPWDKSNPYYNNFFCLTEDHEPLSPGNYMTGFSSTFHFSRENNSYTTDKLEFLIEFEDK